MHIATKLLFGGMHMGRPFKYDWEAIIQQYHASGLSAKLWCNRNNVNYWTFRDHLKRKKREAQVLTSSLALTEVESSHEVVQVHLGDAPAFEHPSQSQEAALIVEISGVKVKVYNNASPAVIKDTIWALRGKC
jgi:hypothetical protein